MKTLTRTADQLAAFGGKPVFSSPPRMAWPPTDKATERALVEIYRSHNYSWNGPWEQQFCRDLAKVHTAKHAAFMVNGTVTLEAALHALGVGRGDEVIVPGLTWLATAMAVIYVGAKPVFVDVEPDTHELFPGFGFHRGSHCHLPGVMGEVERLRDGDQLPFQDFLCEVFSNVKLAT